MYDAYIAKTADGQLYAFYYAPGNGVCQRVYDKGRWEQAISVAVEAAPGFTVSHNGGGRFYVLYRDNEGTTRMLAGDKNGYEPLDTGREFSSSGEIYAVVSGNGNFFISEEQSEDGGISLVSRGDTVDSHFRTAECGFRAQNVSGDHTILFYHTPKSSQNYGFGYRELNISKTGEFKPVHIGAGVFRYSALTTDDAVHFLYITRGMFGDRLLYRKKHGAGLSAAVTVCEGGGKLSCWLFIVKNRIYAAYLSAGSLYVCVSDDDGQSFRRPLRYRSKFCESPVKAAYLSAVSLDENELAVREVYVDSLQPWDVQVLPEVYGEFFLDTSDKRQEARSQKQEARSQMQEARTQRQEVTEQSKGDASVESLWYGDDMPEADKLRNQVDMLERRLLDKDRQFTVMKQEIETQRAVIERLYLDREQNRDVTIN